MEQEAESKSPERPQDASRRETWIYALGDMESSIVGGFFPNLRKIMVVAMHVNPILIGFIEAVVAFWESIAGPVVAHLSDNARSRWGRRKPFLLFGGIGRALVLVVAVIGIPLGAGIARNDVMEAQRIAKDGRAAAADLQNQAIELLAGRGEGSAERLRERSEEERRRLEAARDTLRAEARRRGGGDPDDPVRSALELAEEGLARAVAAGVLVESVGDAVTERAELSVDPRGIESAVHEQLRALGITPISPFERPSPAPPTAPGFDAGSFWEPLVEGWRALLDPEAAAQRRLVLYVMLATLVFVTVHKFHGVPYHALGLELCPSYHGRTRVVTYRKAVGKIGSLLSPWIPVFCFSLWFANAIEGLWWVAVLGCAVGIPTTLVLCLFTRERPPRPTVGAKRPGFLKSAGALAGNPYVIRLLAIFLTLGLANGTFSGFSFFLNTYWVMGSALAASKLGLGIAMLAWALGFLSLPLIQWSCGRFQKHRVLRVALGLMIAGSALKWWAFDPDHPEYQFVLPFLFSLGIGTVYTVLQTMLSDIADDDELKHGVRREAMLGAVMASLMKISGVLVPLLSSAALVLSGYDAALEYEQSAETIRRMRVMNSWAPAILLLLPMLLLWRYPLTRERVEANQAVLAERRRREGEAGV